MKTGLAYHGQTRRTLRRSLRPLSRIVGAFSIILMFVFCAGFLIFVDHVASLNQPIELTNADGIVVLTGGSSRMDAGLELLKAGKAKRLLISGVNPKARLDDLQHATGGDKSMFSCCIDIDRAALNTIGNAQESAKWAISNTFNSVIVVTNNYHIPRSLLEMRRLLPNAQLTPYPVIHNPLTGAAWIRDADAFRVLGLEYTKYVAALLRSYLPIADTLVLYETTAIAHKSSND